jgi:hypothetical protein
LIIICPVLLASIAVQAQDSNFPDRKALILNTCPYVELSNFSFANQYVDRRTRFEQNLTWKNIGSQPLIAFEVVILKYDAFDQRVIGSRWTVTGKNSADWRPLAPGDSGSDGTIGYGTEEVFTAIAYVRAARLKDGTVWRANEFEVTNALRRVAPGIKDPGSLRPDPKAKPE